MQAQAQELVLAFVRARGAEVPLEWEEGLAEAIAPTAWTDACSALDALVACGDVERCSVGCGERGAVLVWPKEWRLARLAPHHNSSQGSGEKEELCTPPVPSASPTPSTPPAPSTPPPRVSPNKRALVTKRAGFAVKRRRKETTGPLDPERMDLAGLREDVESKRRDVERLRSQPCSSVAVQAEVERTNELADKWLEVAQNALEQLQHKTPEQTSIAQWLSHLNIDPEMVRFDTDAECFF